MTVDMLAATFFWPENLPPEPDHRPPQAEEGARDPAHPDHGSAGFGALWTVLKRLVHGPAPVEASDRV